MACSSSFWVYLSIASFLIFNRVLPVRCSYVTPLYISVHFQARQCIKFILRNESWITCWPNSVNKYGLSHSFECIFFDRPPKFVSSEASVNIDPRANEMHKKFLRQHSCRICIEKIGSICLIFWQRKQPFVIGRLLKRQKHFYWEKYGWSFCVLRFQAWSILGNINCILYSWTVAV